MIFDRDLLSYERRKEEHRIDVDIFAAPLLVAIRIVIIIVRAAMSKRCNPLSFFMAGNVCSNLYVCRDSHGLLAS